MIRSFIALPLPAGCTRTLEALQGGLTVARPVPSENMHLTLAFLGEQPEADLRALCIELGDIRVEPFEITLSGMQFLGGKDSGIIAVEADGGEPLTRLQAKVTRIVREAGITLNRQKFRPHVTIFRLSKTASEFERLRIQAWLDARGGFAPITANLKEMALFRSVLKRHGATYDVLADFPFMPPQKFN